MLLTGDKNQDLTNLINIYNESGKMILTGNKDVDYQILNRLTVEDLSKVCRMNKYSQLLCNDGDFWLLKFKNEKLPLLDVDFDWPLSMWLKFYKRTMISKENAIDSFKVYNVQYNNKKKRYIYINNNSRPGFFENILKYFGIFHKNAKYIKIKPDKLYITVKDINDDKYEMTKEEIIDLLTFVYLYNYFFQRFDITCDNIPLIITEEYINDNNIGYERYGILNTIKYYNL